MSECQAYITAFTTPWSTWPFQTFPRNKFRGWTGKRGTDAANAWVFFEQVEANDAAVRIALSGATTIGVQGLTDPNLWYRLETQGTYQKYKYGQYLHGYVCPQISWKSQRDQDIPGTPIMSLTLNLCS
jgi:hypothetical protein